MHGYVNNLECFPHSKTKSLKSTILWRPSKGNSFKLVKFSTVLIAASRHTEHRSFLQLSDRGCQPTLEITIAKSYYPHAL